MNARTFLNCTVALVCAGLLPSCVTTKTISKKCAWCKDAIGTRQYVWDQLGHGVSRVDAGGGIAENLGTAATFPEAEILMKKDAESMGITFENYYFCSLRCLSAYQASLGVKEQRTRIIPHE